VVNLPDGGRLYRMCGTRPHPTLGMVIAPNHTARFVLETPSPRESLPLRLFIGPVGIDELRFGHPLAFDSHPMPGGACRVRKIPFPRQRRVVTAEGQRWAAEVAVRPVIFGPRQATSRIALGVKPASPRADFALVGGALDLGEPGDERHLLWGWTGRLRDSDGSTFRAADEPWSFCLVYLPPGRDYVLELEGRSHVHRQRVSIEVNMKPCSEFRPSPQWGHVRCTIPASALADEVTTIRLAHEGLMARPRPISRPGTADIDWRTRMLAADYRKITITPLETEDATP
jgi:hypothetical protein